MPEDLLTSAVKEDFRDNKIYKYLANKNTILRKEEHLNNECIELLENYKGEIY